jgi:hypothetical protein
MDDDPEGKAKAGGSWNNAGNDSVPGHPWLGLQPRKRKRELTATNEEVPLQG